MEQHTQDDSREREGREDFDALMQNSGAPLWIAGVVVAILIGAITAGVQFLTAWIWSN